MPALVTEVTEFNQLEFFLLLKLQFRVVIFKLWFLKGNFPVFQIKNVDQIGKWFDTKEYIVNSCMFVTKAMNRVRGI